MSGFDPAEDAARTRSQLVIRNTWQDLVDAGHDEAAEEIRQRSSLGGQRKLALAYRREYGLVDEPEGDGVTVNT